MRHIAFVWAIFDIISLLWNLYIQLTSSKSSTPRLSGFWPIELKPMRSIRSLLLLNINSFDLITFLLMRRSEIRKLEVVILWSYVTSYVIDLTRSGQFQIITDSAPRGWLSHQSLNLPNQPSDFRINLSDQPFESTFQINLSNQPFESTYAISLLIESAAPLTCGTSLPPKCTYVG